MQMLKMRKEAEELYQALIAGGYKVSAPEENRAFLLVATENGLCDHVYTCHGDYGYWVMESSDEEPTPCLDIPEILAHINALKINQ